ncbi:RagB/SusD family nutrient uptake outer membrane protein [Flavobacterium agricola]|uniref:RagB/SusD family nutrient uptake outer membrane protein n=1 Tax=Flavobacterium agricola TaxID=2870839 RepID=A0ABY6LYY5_9FLAO|nr:RagB/SusD family nutrient uptake outer membrane protein [Flavobacterium agricola]UYW01535.1 RagB/SusD family nutrient uptake outer membrane protein [Flavobacterium agricola]
MRLKNLFYIGSLSAAMLLTTTACSDDYLDISPTDAIAEETVFTSPANLMAAINGMHRNMYVRQNESQGNNGYTAQMIIYDVMGEDLIFPTQGNGWFVSELRWLHTNNENSTATSYIWNFWYRMIKNANNLIVKGSQVATANTEEENMKKSAIAQAYAYRAFGLFQLVQTYGKTYNPATSSTDLGVVIRLDPDDNSAKARATVQEVYDQINADLAEAQTIMSGVKVANKSHISENAIKGIQARVALVQKNYPLAAQKANEARQGLTLMNNEEYVAGFNNYNNPEWMWGIHIVADQTDYFGNFMAYFSRNYSSSQIRSCPKVMNVNLYNALPAGDVRKVVVDPTGKHTDLGLGSTFTKVEYSSQKFLAESQSVSLGDVPFMRAAEMYLIEAEALYHSDEAASKAVLQELVSNRTNNTYTIASTGADYYNEILLQRRAELWGEGFRFLDLKRLNQTLDRSTTNVPNIVPTVLSGGVTTAAPSDARWQWLIPIQEMNSNPLMVQNEFN